MNKQKILVIVFLLFLFKTNYGQSIFTIEEVTENGMMYLVKPDVDSLKKRTRYPNVDINSMLKIKIDKPLIQSEAALLFPSETGLPVERMRDIAQLLEKRTALIEAINFKDTSLEAKKNTLNSFALDVSPILTFVSDSLSLENPLRATCNEIFSRTETDATADYNSFFDALQLEIDRIGNKYDSSVVSNRIYFRLGAFINKKPVHLDGFDTYKEGEFKKIPRFATSISPEEKKNFDTYKKIAEDANKNAELALKNKLNETVAPVIAAIKDSIENFIAEPLLNFNNNIDSLEGIGEAVKLKVAKINSDVKYLIKEVKSVIEFAQKTESNDYVMSLKVKLEALVNTAVQTNGNINEVIVELKNKDLKNAKSSFEGFKKSYESGQKIITNFASDFNNFFDEQTLLGLSTSQKIQESLLKLGNEVKKIPLDNIPTETNLNLITSGDRKDGDKLYLKAVLGKETEDKEAPIENTIEFLPIGLYQIRLHSTITAVLIFADNTTRQFKEASQFQLDPSYSVLFKLGSRQHSNYNDFISLGFGMNMATLDFNNDNTPEIGIGLVASAFRDYLQVGYGRNMGSDDFYFFFGIRLPFLALNLSGNAKVVPGDD